MHVRPMGGGRSKTGAAGGNRVRPLALLDDGKARKRAIARAGNE